MLCYNVSFAQIICYHFSLIRAKTVLFCCSATNCCVTRVDQCYEQWGCCSSVVCCSCCLGNKFPSTTLTTHSFLAATSLFAGDFVPRSPLGLPTVAATTMVSQVAPSERAGEILSPESGTSSLPLVVGERAPFGGSPPPSPKLRFGGMFLCDVSLRSMCSSICLVPRQLELPLLLRSDSFPHIPTVS